MVLYYADHRSFPRSRVTNYECKPTNIRALSVYLVCLQHHSLAAMDGNYDLNDPRGVVMEFAVVVWVEPCLSVPE